MSDETIRVADASGFAPGDAVTFHPAGMSRWERCKRWLRRLLRLVGPGTYRVRAVRDDALLLEEERWDR